MSLTAKSRPKLRSENFTDADTAARVMNTVVLQPLYSRVESLEKRAVLEIRVKTPTPAGNLFPQALPNPVFQVKTLALAYIRNNTTNAPESMVTVPQWDYDSQGRLQLIGMVLSDATDYTLRFEVRG